MGARMRFKRAFSSAAAFRLSYKPISYRKLPRLLAPKLAGATILVISCLAFEFS